MNLYRSKRKRCTPRQMIGHSSQQQNQDIFFNSPCQVLFIFWNEIFPSRELSYFDVEKELSYSDDGIHPNKEPNSAVRCFSHERQLYRWVYSHSEVSDRHSIYLGPQFGIDASKLSLGDIPTSDPFLQVFWDHGYSWYMVYISRSLIWIIFFTAAKARYFFLVFLWFLSFSENEIFLTRELPYSDAENTSAQELSYSDDGIFLTREPAPLWDSSHTEVNSTAGFTPT